MEHIGEQVNVLISQLDETKTLKKKPPVTAKVAGMNRYEAAKELRRRARHLTAKPVTNDPAVAEAIVRLQETIERPRARPGERLDALAGLTQALVAYSDELAKNTRVIQRLAQHLPTAPNLPEGKAENVVRAIAAILKTNKVIP